MTELGVIITGQWLTVTRELRARDEREWASAGNVYQQPENCVTFVCTVLMYVLGINTFILVCTLNLFTNC